MITAMPAARSLLSWAAGLLFLVGLAPSAAGAPAASRGGGGGGGCGGSCGEEGSAGTVADTVALVQLAVDTSAGASPTEPPGRAAQELIRKEIQYFRANQNDAIAAEHSCRQLEEHVRRNHMFVAEYAVEEVHGLAMSALKRYPTIETLQMACAGLLANMAGASRDSAGIIGEAGGLPLLLSAIEKFGAKNPQFITYAARLQDNSLKNKYMMSALGATRIVRDIANEHYEPAVETAVQCFFTTHCGPGDLTEKMAVMGYIPRAIKVMQDFAHEPRIRGEVMAIFANCFVPIPRFYLSLMNEGIVTQAIQAMRDLTAGDETLDDVSPAHLYNNAMTVLTALASANKQWKHHIVEAGAIDEIVMALQRQGMGLTANYKGDVGERACPAAIHLAYAPNVLLPACNALKLLLKGNRRKMTALGIPDTVSTLLSATEQHDRVTNTTCSGLLGMLQQGVEDDTDGAVD